MADDDVILPGIFVDGWRRDLIRQLFEVQLPPVYPNSLEVACAECRVMVWLAPRQQEVEFSTAKSRVLCMNCLITFFNDKYPASFVLRDLSES